MDRVAFGKRLREIRLQRGLSFKEISHQVSVTETMVGDIERSRKIPSLETLMELSNAFQVNPTYLIQDSLNEISESSHRLADMSETLNPHDKRCV